MIFNSLQYNTNSQQIDSAKYALDPLHSNENLDLIYRSYQKIFQRKNVKNISFSKDGFFALICQLKGKIAVSVGESEYIIQGAQEAKKFGVNIEFIPLQKDGTLDLTNIDDSFDFLFVSSYIMDTYVKVDLKKIKELTGAKLISNATAKRDPISDIYLLDSYKLSAQGGMGVAIYDEGFEALEISQINLLVLDLTLQGYQNKKMVSTQKQIFLEELQKLFQSDLYLFIDPDLTLEFTLHIGLKDIKARELIKTLAFEEIYITNGEGCSLGLSQPSRIIEKMGYSEDEARWGVSLDFSEKLDVETIKKIVEKIYKKYRQIKALG